jgi:hypothetical protein
MVVPASCRATKRSFGYEDLLRFEFDTRSRCPTIGVNLFPGSNPLVRAGRKDTAPGG